MNMRVRTLSKFCRTRDCGGSRLASPLEKREQRPPIFYRIHIEQVTGHRATPDAMEAATLGAEETLVYR